MDKRNSKVMVLGASPNPERYAYLAAKRLKDNGYTVIAVGKRVGEIEGVSILNEFPIEVEVDTVSLYLNKRNQLEYEDKILALKPQRIIFNPGAENPNLFKKANELGIEAIEACTLVMLSANTF